MRPIGWYVHHHGAGHLVRAWAVRPLLEEMVVLSSLPRPAGWDGEWIELPRDDEGEEARDPEAGGALHWAPLDDAGLRRRTAAISAWIAAAEPSAFVVDVSVEVSLLVRLHGVPTVLIAQRGRRRDPAHESAYAAATAVAAPWTEVTHLPHQGLPDERLRFLGAVSRFASEPGGAGDAASDDAGAPGEVLLLLGFGGCEFGAEEIVAAAAETPGRRWHLTGPIRATGPPNLVDHGPQAPVRELLRRCSVVVGTAGGNTIAEVAATRRHFVCLPQPRPFEEQLQAGRALGRLEVAEVVLQWPEPGSWEALLRAAENRPVERWAELEDGRGAERLAAAVREVAASVAPLPEAPRPGAVTA